MTERFKLVQRKYSDLKYFNDYQYYFDHFIVERFGNPGYNLVDKNGQLLRNPFIGVLTIYFCRVFMKRDGDWSKLYIWNPETEHHDILVSEWKYSG